jgi:hypothetical protein
MYISLEATQGATLGDFIGLFNAELVACGPEWRFSGTIRYRDNYDFKRIPVGNKVRNLISFPGRVTTNGDDLPIESQLGPATEMSNNQEQQWQGTAIRHP